MQSHIIAAGIALSAVGAFLVWRFLAEVNFADRKAFLQGKGVVHISDPTPKDIEKLRFEIRMSKVGLALILIGGLLQIVGNYMG